MTEVEPEDAFGEALLVKTRSRARGEFTDVQVWYGGTQVRVFTIAEDGTIYERTVWTLTDDKGRPESRSTISHHMNLHFAAMEDDE